MAVEFVNSGIGLTGGGGTTVITLDALIPWGIADGGTGGITPVSARNSLFTFNPQAVGDIYYRSTTTTLARLPIGTDGQLLTIVGGVPAWAGGGTQMTAQTLQLSAASATGGVLGINITDPTEFGGLLSINAPAGAPSALQIKAGGNEGVHIESGGSIGVFIDKTGPGTGLDAHTVDGTAIAATSGTANGRGVYIRGEHPHTQPLLIEQSSASSQALDDPEEAIAPGIRTRLINIIADARQPLGGIAFSGLRPLIGLLWSDPQLQTGWGTRGTLFQFRMIGDLPAGATAVQWVRESNGEPNYHWIETGVPEASGQRTFSIWLNPYFVSLIEVFFARFVNNSYIYDAGVRYNLSNNSIHWSSGAGVTATIQGLGPGNWRFVTLTANPTEPTSIIKIRFNNTSAQAEYVGNPSAGAWFWGAQWSGTQLVSVGGIPEDGAKIVARPSELWSENSTGAGLEFQVTPSGTSGPQQALLLNQDRSLSVVHDGTLKTIEFGDANSAGTGYRSLRIVN